jgi:ribose transport system ATP-binding protein
MIASDVQLAAVEMKGIVKSFNGNPVLHNVDFELRPGEVHALMGGNGAGKSTLMKILQGVYTADGGEIRVHGKPVTIRSPQDAKNAGIGMVFQEFSLIPTLTVAQNIFLAHEPRSGMGLLNDREAEERTRALFNEMNVDIDPRARVSRLSTGYWQLTEIAKALSQNVRILILDEPTAALAASETQALFHLVRTLKSRGISIIYISHRMEEIFQIADRITVMRDGRQISTTPTAELTMPQLVELIVGRKVEQSFVWEERQIDRSGTPLLEVRHLNAGERVQDVSFQLHAGEILGLAGLMGSGRTELVRALFGIDRIQAGELAVRGRLVTIQSPEDALKAGICLVPEDRRAQGLVLSHSVKDNMLLPLLNRIERSGIIDDREGDRLVNSYVESLQIKTDSIRKIIRLLSGGNQQKVVIAKWLASQPNILLMDEPTAGVDIGAKTEICDVIRRLADEGKGVIVISSEFTELLALADRVLVIRGGTVTQEIDRRNIENEEALEQAVQRTSAKEVQLSPDQLERIRAMKATAAIVMHYSGDDWSTAQVAGLKDQFDRMGIQVVAVTDANFDPQKQIADLESVLAKKPNIIVSIPTDPDVTVDAYKKAAAQGVKLVFMDNVPKGLIQGSDYVSVVSSDNYGNGVSSAHMMAENLADRGQIALIYHAADYRATRQRYDALKRTILESYPDIQIVEEQGIHGPNFAAEAEGAATAMLEKYPDLKGIWAVWDIPAEGVITAIRRAGRSDVIVTTIDLGKTIAIELARGGVVKGVRAQRPFDQGVTEAILAGYALLGEPAPADVIFDGLAVTQTNLQDAWKTIYRQNPPVEVQEAIIK